jgi:beta-glucuronidase
VIAAFVSAIGALTLGPAVRTAAAQTGLRFVKPTAVHLAGTTDLSVDAPAGTTAVRFYLDQVQLSELTDLYARQTGTAPVWATATDVGWFPAGDHTLRAEADTPGGTVTTTEHVVTTGEAAGHGVLPLNGGWRFATTGELPAGALDGTSPPAVQPGYDAHAWPAVVVPDSFGAVKAKWDNDNGLLGVYRRTVDLDAPRPGERTALVFESCFWACRYFVNGSEVGSSTGGYLPARLDVTAAVRAGTNTIAVVVDNRVSTMGDYARPVQGLYWNWGGLLQQVHLERTPSVALTETRAEGTLAGRLTVRPTGVNATGAARQVPLMLSVEGPGGSAALPPRKVTTTVPAGGGDATPITVDVPHPKAWDLDHPTLYTVRLRPLEGGRELTEQTGFRDVAVHGLDVYLNGRPVQDLQGFDRHADYPGLGRTQPDGLADREIEQLHARGFRIFRPAHYATTPAELHAADKYGLLVIEEINNVTSQPAAFLDRSDVHEFAKRTLARMVARDRGHPSLFAWSVGNENATDTPQGAEYVHDVISYGKGIDPTRLYTQVTDHPTTDLAYPYEDFLAENYYAGWYSGTVDAVGPLLDTVQQRAGKPIMISEYGAEAVVGRTGQDRGGEWYQAYIVDGYNRQLAHRPHFIGKLYWTTTEFWCTPTWSGGNPQPVPPFHAKALETYFRQPKLGWKVMFSPVRITAGTVLEAPPGKQVALRERVTIADTGGHGAHGTVVVDPQEGFTARPVPFAVQPNARTTVDVTLDGMLASDGTSSGGYVRAVIDSDTEALPLPLTVRAADTVRGPASDDFAAASLDPAWQVVRPQEDGWSLSDRPGSLRLSTLPGGQTGTTNDGRNLFVRTNTPDTDFTAVASVGIPNVSADFQQVGLYAYVDDDDYAKIDLGWIDGRRAIEFVTEAAGKVGTRVSVPYDHDTARLRIVRRGAGVAGEYSADGHDWYPVGNGTLGGTPKVALHAAGGSASPPVVPAYVDDLSVLTSGTLAVTGIMAPGGPMFTGTTGQADVTVTNSGDQAAGVDATLDVPAGWSAGTVHATVPAFGRSTVHVPLTAGGTPQAASIKARVTGQDGATVNGDVTAQVLSAPRGDQVPLALDAGTPTSPVFTTYRRLSPSDGWDAATGYGWVGSPPQSRDRGGSDDLRRDIVTDTAPRTLRLAVPPGPHDVYLLVGDHGFPSDAMTVSSEGRTLTHLATPLSTDEFQWLKFPVDGGPSGRNVDLDFTADNPGGYWRFAGLVIASGGNS